jgi:hypothetical protein
VLSQGSTTRQIVAFLEAIGLSVRCGQLYEPTVLPGLTVERGVLVIDPAAIRWPGDILHEAGHLAVLTPAQRSSVTHNFGSDGGYEMAAIAWSWAARCHLGLDPSVVFHEDGYQAGSGSLIENFSAGRYVGVPILQWLGLTVDAARAAELGIDPYAAMVRWLVD